MNVELKLIRSNHEPNSISSDAVSIRKNKTQFVNTPEWIKGVSVVAEDSLAAYAMKETEGNAITIQPSFEATVEKTVRTVDPTKNPPNRQGMHRKDYPLYTAALSSLGWEQIGGV